eukprot:scaffold17913_cov112-Isochrysis_galbana.AAC.2
MQPVASSRSISRELKLSGAVKAGCACRLSAAAGGSAEPGRYGKARAGWASAGTGLGTCARWRCASRTSSARASGRSPLVRLRASTWTGEEHMQLSGRRVSSARESSEMNRGGRLLWCHGGTRALRAAAGPRLPDSIQPRSGGV